MAGVAEAFIRDWKQAVHSRNGAGALSLISERIKFESPVRALESEGAGHAAHRPRPLRAKLTDALQVVHTPYEVRRARRWCG